ncbi:MAG: LacI family DNA-binding transcriptional regulator [Kiritimatiellales bacterium]|jgi:LacI family kdg operon repressor
MAAPKKKRKRTSDRITLDDISRYCNVSKATVSRVLNNKLKEFPVSEEMILKVKNAAQHLGYRPNRLARAVRSQRTNLIGLSFIHIDYQSLPPDQIAYENQVMGEFTNIILSHPGFKEYDLVIHDRNEDPANPLRESDFKTDLLDGMIYLTPSENHTEFLDIASPEFPIVLLGYTPGAEQKVPCVDINNRKAAQLAVEHLIHGGRKKILMLIPEKLQHLCCIQERLLGYKDALAANQLTSPSEFIRTVRCLPEAVSGFLRELRCLDEIDAIFCPQDELAALCIRTIQALGKRVPEDIAIIGFDDTTIAQHTTPALSSVHRPVEKQAHEAIDLLLKIMKKEIPYAPGFHEIDTRIIVRDSTVKNHLKDNNF